jgi:hypothetical protein
MAKKPSSRAKKSKRSVEQSAAKGGGIMSINKSSTSIGMKIILVILIVAFVMLFTYGGITGIIELFTKQPKAAVADPVTAIKDRYEPQVAVFQTAAASSPTSYTVLVTLADTYYSYSVALEQLSQPSTESATLAIKQWAGAKAAYAKALKIKGKKADRVLRMRYAESQYSSGDATSAVKTALAVSKGDPKFATPYLYLGLFYETQGKPQKAIAAYQRYIVLDPTGTAGNPAYAVQQLKSLGGSVPSTAGLSPAPSSASSPTTQ